MVSSVQPLLQPNRRCDDEVPFRDHRAEPSVHPRHVKGIVPRIDARERHGRNRDVELPLAAIRYRDAALATTVARGRRGTQHPRLLPTVTAGAAHAAKAVSYLCAQRPPTDSYSWRHADSERAVFPLGERDVCKYSHSPPFYRQRANWFKR